MGSAGISDQNSALFPFDNSYSKLSDKFYARVVPTAVPTPRLLKMNEPLAGLLGLDVEALSSPSGVAVLGGCSVAVGSEPLAMAYAGHQFGYFVAQLGDGRANLLGEVVGRDGVRYDVQLKGAGRTPFSRNGDGRAALGPVLREYIVSEAMAALGVPTTRALAAVATGQTVFRETALPGAVLTRVASSHLRVGTFQYFFAKGDVAALRELADYAIARHYAPLRESEKPYRRLLDCIVERQSKLVASWMQLGFIHGVMNTDNTSISGETIDYGPCAFMETYDPHTVFSSIDHQGRYCYRNQPHAMHWNLARLAESLLPLLVLEEGGDEAGLASAYAALERFGVLFEAEFYAGMRKKLGLLEEQADDRALIDAFLNTMEENRADFTLTFRRLCDAADGNTRTVRSLFLDPTAFDHWENRWRARLALEAATAELRAAAMRSANPLFIPRNHLVEAAIQAAVRQEDFSVFEQLLEVVLHPYEDRPGAERYWRPATAEECVKQTFCGT